MLKPYKHYYINTDFDHCPGFGQDRVSSHRNPGRGTAGRRG